MITIESLDKIQKAAKEFIEVLKEIAPEHKTDIIASGMNIGFYGEMGVGKTTFIKALCHELGVIDNVNSPTFAIVNEYHTETEKVIYHFDFYRIKNELEVYDLGYEYYFFGNNFCLIEWPKKVEALMPERAIRVYITQNEDTSRTLEIKTSKS